MAVIKKTCPKCGKKKKMTRHHYMPVRWYGNGANNAHILLICRKCHDDLEKLIPYEKQSIGFYFKVVQIFLCTNTQHPKKARVLQKQKQTLIGMSEP